MVDKIKQIKITCDNLINIMKKANTVEDLMASKKDLMRYLASLLWDKDINKTISDEDITELLLLIERYHEPGDRYGMKLNTQTKDCVIDDIREHINFSIKQLEETLKPHSESGGSLIVSMIPMGANHCYFCMALASLNCRSMCPYGEIHGFCSESDSSYNNLSNKVFWLEINGRRLS